MASPSSSVSQESLDYDEGNQSYSNRTRSRIRVLRARGGVRTDRDAGDSCDGSGQNGDHMTGEGEGVEHAGDSARTLPNRDRLKDKRTRPSHLPRGKLPKDKRKLREKRRSTGVAHLPSTESTGDSLDDDDTDKERPIVETTRNTKYNEIIDADNPQTPSEDHGRKSFAARRNKSPSDLEADLEDNQDYDSTVSQSECNLLLIGQGDSVTQSVNSAPVSNNSIRNVGYPKTEYSYDQTNRNYQSVRNPATSQTKTSFSPLVLSRYSESSEVRRQKQPSVLSRYQPDKINAEKETHKSEFSSRFRDREISTATNSRVLSPKENIKDSVSPRAAYSSRQSDLPSSAQVDKLQEENRRLEKLLDDKNRRIAELEEKISLLNTQTVYVKEQNEDLQGENSALLRALARLTA